MRRSSWRLFFRAGEQRAPDAKPLRRRPTPAPHLSHFTDRSIHRLWFPLKCLRTGWPQTLYPVGPTVTFLQRSLPKATRVASSGSETRPCPDPFIPRDSSFFQGTSFISGFLFRKMGESTFLSNIPAMKSCNTLSLSRDEWIWNRGGKLNQPPPVGVSHRTCYPTIYLTIYNSLLTL